MKAPSSASILVVDDDALVRRLIADVLTPEGYAVYTAPSLKQGEALAAKQTFEFIILDRNLPDGDGAEFCLALRKSERTANVPIIFLSSKADINERIFGLEMGADDYLPKPFSGQELLARVRALGRRASRPMLEAAAIIKAGPLTMDTSAHKVFLKGKELALWQKEFDLLAAFMRKPGVLLTRSALLKSVWGSGLEVERFASVVDVTLSNLRKKLGAYGEKIVTIRGQGFRFDP